jgi:hypothetical protein
MAGLELVANGEASSEELNPISGIGTTDWQTSGCRWAMARGGSSDRVAGAWRFAALTASIRHLRG